MEEREYLDYLSLPTGLYNQIESDVTDLFLELNIRSYPVDPVEIALSLGYELISVKILDHMLIPKQAIHIRLR